MLLYSVRAMPKPRHADSTSSRGRIALRSEEDSPACDQSVLRLVITSDPDDHFQSTSHGSSPVVRRPARQRDGPSATSWPIRDAHICYRSYSPNATRTIRLFPINGPSSGSRVRLADNTHMFYNTPIGYAVHRLSTSGWEPFRFQLR